MLSMLLHQLRRSERVRPVVAHVTDRVIVIPLTVLPGCGHFRLTHDILLHQFQAKCAFVRALQVLTPSRLHTRTRIPSSGPELLWRSRFPRQPESRLPLAQNLIQVHARESRLHRLTLITLVVIDRHAHRLHGLVAATQEDAVLFFCCGRAVAQLVRGPLVVRRDAVTLLRAK